MASIADVQAFEDLLSGMDDLTRASIERALDLEVERRVDEMTGGWIDPLDHEVVVDERDAAKGKVVTLEQEVADLRRALTDCQAEIQRLRAA